MFLRSIRFRATTFAVLVLSGSAVVLADTVGDPRDTLPKTEGLTESTTTIDVQKSQANKALEQTKSKQVQVRKFQIAGVNAIPFELVSAEFAPMAGKQVAEAELIAAADRVTKLYQQRGYPISFAYVPAQNFADGIVRVNIVEGFVGKIIVNGDAGGSKKRVEAIADQLRADKPLSNDRFQRVAGLLNLLPGLQISASVAPPVTIDGSADMTITIKRRAVTVSVAADTSSSDVRGLIAFTENSMSPLGEQVTVSTLQPSGSTDTKYYAVDYIQLIGANGLKLHLNAYDYSGNPNNSLLEAQALQSVYQVAAKRVGATLSYPVLLNGYDSIAVAGSLYAASNASTYHFKDTSRPDINVTAQTRVLSFEPTMTHNTATSVTQISIGMFQGLDVAGASIKGGPAKPDFDKIRMQASHTVVYPSGWGYAVSGMLQYSADSLPQSEQVSFGGRQYGLAYQTGEISGDQGWGFSIEGSHSYTLYGNYVKRLQPYIKYEMARTHLNNYSLPSGSIASLSSGIRIANAQFYSVDFSVSKPTGNRTINGHSRPLRFNLAFSFQAD